MNRKASAWGTATLLCCAVGFYLRWLNAHTNLEIPSVDENDVVQQAVAFMGGEWQYRQFGYGAFPMYCLAALYHAAGALHGLTGFQYAMRVFYDGGEHYLLARFFCGACSLPLAIASYRFVAPRFGRAGAALGACLLSWPCVELLTRGTVRVDVVQAACQVGSVLFLARAVDSKSWRPWLGAGVLAGLGLASKPLPGLLVAPCFLAASWFAAVQETEAARETSSRDWKGHLRAIGVRCVRTLFRPALWVAGVVAVASQFLANPTSLELRAFIASQLETSAYYSGSQAPGSHLTPFQALYDLQWPFCTAAALSVLLLVFVPDLRARVIALFPLVYMTAFWGRPTRIYYMVAPAMALCIVIGIGAGILLCRLGWDAPAGAETPHVPAAGRAASVVRNAALSALFCLALAAGVIWTPAWALEARRVDIDTAALARHWIYENIPSGTALFHYGRYPAGPHLVASSWKEEARWADFFDYGRNDYKFYRDAARQAYEEYRRAGRPWYEIEGHQARPDPVSASSKTWLTRSLAKHARDNHQQYIILAGYRLDDYRLLGYRWFDQVELAQQYAGEAILRVLPEPPKEEQPPAAGAIVRGNKASSG
jgi:hypothetical protein